MGDLAEYRSHGSCINRNTNIRTYGEVPNSQTDKSGRLDSSTWKGH